MTAAHNVLAVQKCNPSARVPVKATDGAAAFDMHACIPAGKLILPPHTRRLIGTGLAVEIPEGWYMQLSIRSGLALKHGLILMNGVGIIDADYRDEVGGIVYNSSDTAYEFSHGERFVQAVLLPRPHFELMLVDALTPANSNRTGGYGSTGRG